MHCWDALTQEAYRSESSARLCLAGSVIPLYHGTLHTWERHPLLTEPPGAHSAIFLSVTNNHLVMLDFGGITSAGVAFGFRAQRG